MSGIYLYERLLEYHHIFEQRVQTIFPGSHCGDGDFFPELPRKEVGSIIAVRMRMTFVLSGGIWMEALYPGGTRG
jgi:hypothetical protein